MDPTLQNRLFEIGQHLANEDLNRAGIRFLDLLHDFDYLPIHRQQALELRKRYNQAKELGKNKIEDQALVGDFNRFLDSIKELTVTPYVRERGLICKAEGISKEFRSRLRTFKLNEMTLLLMRGKIVGVVGENGNGKTTLLRMIAGDLASDTGFVEYYFNGQPETDWARNKLRIAFVQQRLERWHGRAYEYLSFMASIKGFNDVQNKERTEFIVHRLGLTNFAEHTWAQLSSGYRLRFEIAKALIWDPAILILDEPLANLDMQAQELMLHDLRNLADSMRNPVSIILSSQQLHEVEAVSDQIIFLKNGRAVFNGELSEFAKTESLHTFEINGRFEYQQLQAVFSEWEGLKIEQSVSAFILTCPEKYTRQDLFNKISSQKLDVEYFRDITGSTKKLFSDKY